MISQAALAILQGEDFFFDGALREELVDEHRFVLADAMRTRRGLLFDRRIPPGVVVNHRVCGGEIEPRATGFETNQKQRHASLLKFLYRRFSVLGLTGEFGVLVVALFQFNLYEFQHRSELRKQQDLAPFVKQFIEHFHQRGQFGRRRQALCHHRFGGCQLDQSRITTDLTQFKERVQNHDLAASHPLRQQGLSQLGVEHRAQRFVNVALTTFDFHPANHLGTRRQIGQHLFLGSAQQKRPHAVSQAHTHFFIALLFNRRTKHLRET